MPLIKIKFSNEPPLKLLNYMQRPDRVQPPEHEEGPPGEMIINCTGNTIGATPQDIAAEMQGLGACFNEFLGRSLRTYMHLIISYSPEDSRRYSDETFLRHLRDTMANFKSWQWSAALHRNTDNLHWHVCINLIKLDGKRIQTQQIWEKIRPVSDEQAAAHGLSVIATSWLARIKKDDPIYEVSATIVNVLSTKRFGNLISLWKSLAMFGACLMRSGDKGGLIYEWKGKSIKASRIGRIAQLHGLRLIQEHGFEAAVELIQSMHEPSFRELNARSIGEDYWLLLETKASKIRGSLKACIMAAKAVCPDLDAFTKYLDESGVSILHPNEQGRSFVYAYRSGKIDEKELPEDCHYLNICDYYSSSTSAPAGEDLE